MRFISPSPWKRAFWCLGLCAGLLFLVLTGGSLFAAGTNDAPVEPKPAPAQNERIGQFLVEHQEDLSSFFEGHTDDLVKQGLPLFLEVLGNIILLNILVGWGFDVGISFGFASLFAPAYARITKALAYATGRLFLGLLIGVGGGLIALGAGMIHPMLVLVVIGCAVVIDFVVQTWWVIALYRTSALVSALFYLGLVLVHIIAGALVLGPLIKPRVGIMMTQFVDQNVTAHLKTETVATKQDLAKIEGARDKAKADVNDVQVRIDLAASQEKMLRDEIEAKKNSEAYLYGQLVQSHARGDLAGARNQLTAYLAKFPAGSLTDSAKGQLAQVESELTVQDIEKKQAEADALHASEQARADLLSRVSKGEATLSEMRQVLYGKSRTDVSALLGKPSDTASDRWGYSQEMVLNPMTNEKHGLAIYFSEGAVQSVDYYYTVGR